MLGIQEEWMVDLKVESVVIEGIRNMPGLGFAWADVFVILEADDTTAHPGIEIEVPLTYRADETMGVIRSRVYERTIAILRATVEHLEASPPVSEDKRPPPFDF